MKVLQHYVYWLSELRRDGQNEFIRAALGGKPIAINDCPTISIIEVYQLPDGYYAKTGSIDSHNTRWGESFIRIPDDVMKRFWDKMFNPVINK